MANVQKQFAEFHYKIRLKPYTDNKTLREKRNAVLNKLKERLTTQFEERGEPAPKYSSFNQGSYELGTGIRPSEDDFDIDVGLAFEVSTDDHPNPVQVKKWVYDALQGHTQSVEIRRPCVTVAYQSGDDQLYHVDLAVYSDGESNVDGKTYLARGKPGSLAENRFWEEADPHGLVETLRARFDGDDWAQFRRCVRYLKRWKALKFPSDGNAAPSGIGVTVAAYYWFQPRKTQDPITGESRHSDLQALVGFVDAVLGQFRPVVRDGEIVERLEVTLPVAPENDILCEMTDKQMATLEDKLEQLSESLDAASSEVDPVEACKTLRKMFGDDFPVPPKNDTGQAKAPAIITSSSAA